MIPIKTILHPTDFSEYSAHAFHLACALARDYEAKLVVLHVMPPVVLAPLEIPLPAEYDDSKTKARERLFQVAPLDPKVRMEHLLAQGDTVKEILHAAKENQCDLIFMGTHGRTGLGRVVLGSVAEQVMRKAPCPVLSVKLPMPQETAPGKPARQKKASTASV